MSAHRILLINGIVSMLTGVELVLFREMLAPHFGLTGAMAIELVGVVCLVFGAAAFWMSRRAGITRSALLTFSVADGTWVAASALLLALFWNDWTVLGRMLVIVAALVVEAFAYLEFKAASLAPAPARA